MKQTKTDRELTLTTTIAAPRAKVYEAWTEHLPEWWGPHGTTVPEYEMELRPGGRLRTVMIIEGNRYDTDGVFLEVSQDWIIFTDAFKPGWIPNPEKFFVGVFEFNDVPEGTEVVARALHWDEAARQKHEEMGFFGGWGQMLERLEAVATKL
ncbi:MAG: SRPBCC domain-containing protein [Armatimonadetes bacterium]|nr:SRPBCC domain-containing protein [Armatimonadota bacterium]MBS1728953.1 SRPBCC domain-containing protein [Armatimonadota bacterium]